MAQASALRPGQQPAEAKIKIASTKVKPSYKHVPHSQKPPHLVAKRNARERRRVQAVNQAFYKLRKCVPIENRNKRVSKVKTLQRAIDYIRKLERILADDDDESQQQQSAVEQVADTSAASADRRPTPARRTRKPTANCDQAAPVAADQPRPQTGVMRQRRGRRTSPATGSLTVQAVGTELTPQCQAQASESSAAYLATGAQTEAAKFAPPAGSESAGFYCQAYPQQDEVLRESSAYNNSLNYFAGEQHYPAANYSESHPPVELYGAAYSASGGYLYAGYTTEPTYPAGEPDWQRQSDPNQQLAVHKSVPAASSFAPLHSPLSSASNSSSNSSADSLSTGTESGPVCRQRASANIATQSSQQQQVNSYLPYAAPLPARTIASRPAHLSFAHLAYQQSPAQQHQQQQQLDGRKESAVAPESVANELAEASAHHQVRHLLSGGQPNNGLSANSLHEQQHQYHQHHQHGHQQQSFQSNQRQHHLNHPSLNHLNNGGQHSNNGLNAIRAPATLMQTTATTSTIQEYTTSLL